MSIDNELSGAVGDPVIGLPSLLRLWRARAGRRMGIGRGLSQQDVAEDTGISPRWYGELERGAQPRLSREKIERLADALMLEEGERKALFLYTLGSVPESPVVQLPTGQADRYLQMLLDQQMPRPAYLNDARWNIVGYNASMAEWFPWVRKPGANLLRWSLMDREAREQLVGWRGHAKTYLAMIRVALAARPNDPELTQILRDALRDPEVMQIWQEEPKLVAYRDGDRFRLHLKRFDYADLDVVSHVFLPATYRDLRFVIITWLGSEDEPSVPDELRPVAESPHVPSLPRVPPASSSSRPYLNVDTREEVEHLAGEARIPLPRLASLLGPDYCAYFDPGIAGQVTPTVVLGARQSNGSWDIDLLDLGSALRRLCPADPTSEAGEEYRSLLRALIPAEPQQARAALSELASLARSRLTMYTELLGEIDRTDATA